MYTEPADPIAPQSVYGRLEIALMDDYLERYGQSFHALFMCPEASAKGLLRSASIYASGKLAEIEAKSHFLVTDPFTL